MTPTEREVEDALTIGAKVRLLINIDGSELFPGIPKGSIVRIHSIDEDRYWVLTNNRGSLRALYAGEFEFAR